MGQIFGSEHYVGKKKKNYFEGWYFRHNSAYPFSFIAGVSRAEGDEHSFVQYIDCNCSRYFRFALSDFSYNKTDMEIRIGNNVFSQRGISADVGEGDGRITADVGYSGMVRYKKSLYAPSVMGPFSYLPMVCRHGIISLDHAFEGTLSVGVKTHLLTGKGYIEKDFGNSFPENYFWMHASAAETSIMCAVAWPLIFGIRGFLCVISHKGKQYNLSLYSGAKLKKFSVTPDGAHLIIKKGGSELTVTAASNASAQKLIAPDRGGNMTIEINENLLADLSVFLTLRGEQIDLRTLTTSCFESVLK